MVASRKPLKCPCAFLDRAGLARRSTPMNCNRKTPSGSFAERRKSPLPTCSRFSWSRLGDIWRGCPRCRRKLPNPASRAETRRSGENLLDDFAMHIGQAHIAAAEAHSQALVIDTEQVQ